MTALGKSTPSCLHCVTSAASTAGSDCMQHTQQMSNKNRNVSHHCWQKLLHEIAPSGDCRCINHSLHHFSPAFWSYFRLPLMTFNVHFKSISPVKKIELTYYFLYSPSQINATPTKHLFLMSVSLMSEPFPSACSTPNFS